MTGVLVHYGQKFVDDKVATILTDLNWVSDGTRDLCLSHDAFHLFQIGMKVKMKNLDCF